MARFVVWGLDAKHAKQRMKNVFMRCGHLAVFVQIGKRLFEMGMDLFKFQGKDNKEGNLGPLGLVKVLADVRPYPFAIISQRFSVVTDIYTGTAYPTFCR